MHCKVDSQINIQNEIGMWNWHVEASQSLQDSQIASLEDSLPKTQEVFTTKDCKIIIKTACQVTSVVSDSVRPHGLQPTRLLHPWDSPGKNTGVGCHFLLQGIKVESEVTQLCPTLSDPMDCSLPGSSVHGIFQARVLEWGAIAFSVQLFATPLTATRQASLSITNSQNLFKFMSIELVMPSNHLILCCPLLLLSYLSQH